MRALFSPTQRRVLAALPRRPATPAALARQLPRLCPQTVERALRALLEEGAAARTVKTSWARHPARGVATYVYRATRPEIP